MTVRIGLCGTACLALAVLAGCGGSSSTPAHRAPIAAVSQPANKTTQQSPPPDGQTQVAMGQIMAVRKLAHEAAGLLDNAAEAKSEQLPASATADFHDALSRIVGAQTVLGTLRAPAEFNAAVLDLRMAVGALGAAADERAPSGRSAREGRQSLGRADAALRGKIPISLSGVTRAEQFALRAASRAVEAQRVARQAAQKRARRARATATPTAIPTATPLPPTATPVIHVTRHHVTRHHVTRHARRHSPLRHRARVRTARHRHVARAATPRPTATLRPTNTPVPTSTPRPTNTPVPASVAALAPYISRLQGAQTQVDAASRALDRCATYVDGIRSGTDTGGTVRIHHCLETASAALTQTVRLLTPVTGRVTEPTVTRTLGAAVTSMQVVQVELRSAGQHVDSIDLDAAYTDLQAAIGRVRALSEVLTTAVAKRPL